MLYYAIVLGFFFVFCQTEQVKARGLILDAAQDDVALGPYAEILEDKLGSLTIKEILDEKRNDGWFVSDNPIFNFGFTDSVIWLKARVKNKTSAPLERLIDIAYPLLDYIRVFIVRDNKLSEAYILGDEYPFSARIYNYRNFLIPITIEPSETLDLVLRVQSSSSLQLPVSLVSPKAFIEHKQLRLAWYGMYYGIILAMVIYNLFVFISVKEKVYLYYVFYALSMSLLLSCLNGFSYQYLWPDSIVWNSRAISVSICSVLLFAILFTRIFLDLPRSNPFLDQMSIYLVVIWTILLGFSLILHYPYQYVSQLILIVALITVSFALISALYGWYQGYAPARYYTISWLIMLLGGAIICLNKMGLVMRNNLTENTLQYGSAIEVLLLSFALADRLSMEKNIRYKAQQEALANQKQVRLAQEEALKIQKKANETLEYNVRMRTRELEIANSRLQELSTTDSLTGLKNRRYFNEIYYKEYSRAMREKTPLSCLLMDIDRFKSINDTFGHLVGDECLKKIANGIQHQLQRGNDFLARYGGEEFCVLLTNTMLDGALQVAEKIRACVETITFNVKDETVRMTISIGVSSEIPGPDTNPETLLNRTDSALYQAKSRGRNKVVGFKPDMD